jgi:hypothetical protein
VMVGKATTNATSAATSLRFIISGSSCHGHRSIAA